MEDDQKSEKSVKSEVNESKDQYQLRKSGKKEERKITFSNTNYVGYLARFPVMLTEIFCIPDIKPNLLLKRNPAFDVSFLRKTLISDEYTELM